MSRRIFASLVYQQEKIEKNNSRRNQSIHVTITDIQEEPKIIWRPCCSPSVCSFFSKFSTKNDWTIILKRNKAKLNFSFYRKKLYFCTHFKRSSASGWRPGPKPLALPNRLYPPGGWAERRKIIPPPGRGAFALYLFLPATNQSISLFTINQFVAGGQT